MYTTTTFAPGYTIGNFPGGFASLTVDEKIDAFYQRYTVWVLSYAKRLLDVSDSGFAVLLLLNPYFEMIACRLQGVPASDRRDRKRGYSSGKQWKTGLQEVFPEIKTSGKGEDTCKQLYLSVRNELAHYGFISKPVGLSEDYKDAITFGEPGQAVEISINPRAWCARICDHFDQYIAQLKDPGNQTLREKFLCSFE